MFLFDTDTLSNLGKVHPSPRLLRQLATTPGAIYTSAITVAEIARGAHKSATPPLVLKRLSVTLQALSGVLPFDRRAAEVYGELAAALEKQGLPIGLADVQIAAIALSRDRTVVTHNVTHFNRVGGLRVEDWL